MLKRFVVFGALVAASTVPVAAPADAAVTNCQSVYGTVSFSGKCFSTTANPPYTTQYVMIGECKAGSNRTSTAGNWKTVGQSGSSIAYCPSGWTTVGGSQYFLFR